MLPKLKQKIFPFKDSKTKTKPPRPEQPTKESVSRLIRKQPECKHVTTRKSLNTETTTSNSNIYATTTELLEWDRPPDRKYNPLASATDTNFELIDFSYFDNNQSQHFHSKHAVTSNNQQQQQGDSTKDETTSTQQFQLEFPNSKHDLPYAIALYDYFSTNPGDLQFVAGDIIYLRRRIDENWLFGTSASGLYKGIFPESYVHTIVSIPSSTDNEFLQKSTKNPDDSSYPTQHMVPVIHAFKAMEPNDLDISEGDVVLVKGRINKDWLYGELCGKYGQFPASFLEFVPLNLPIVILKSNKEQGEDPWLPIQPKSD